MYNLKQIFSDLDNVSDLFNDWPEISDYFKDNFNLDEDDLEIFKNSQLNLRPVSSFRNLN